jgi:hypothetical protein
MKYQPSAIAQVDLDISEAPYLGGEFAVYLSRVPAVLLGTVTMTASGNGVDSTNVTWAESVSASIKTGGADLQLVATGELSSPNGACVVVFDVKDETNAARTLTFTFDTPTRLQCQDSSFPRSYAKDGVLSGGNLVTEIVDLKSVLNGNRAVTFGLYQLPEAADYVLVGSTTEKKFNTKSRRPVGIDEGMEADKYVKRGKTGKGELSLDSKYGGQMDRLSRFDGAKTTAMLLGIKDGQVTTDRLVFTQFVPGVEVNLPDGDGEAMENAASGKWVEMLSFCAGN